MKLALYEILLLLLLLSQRTLTKDEEEVPKLGLNFAATPTKIPVKEIVASTELARTWMTLSVCYMYITLNNSQITLLVLRWKYRIQTKK